MAHFNNYRNYQNNRKPGSHAKHGYGFRNIPNEFNSFENNYYYPQRGNNVLGDCINLINTLRPQERRETAKQIFDFFNLNTDKISNEKSQMKSQSGAKHAKGWKKLWQESKAYKDFTSYKNQKIQNKEELNRLSDESFRVMRELQSGKTLQELSQVVEVPTGEKDDKDG